MSAKIVALRLKHLHCMTVWRAFGSAVTAPP